MKRLLLGAVFLLLTTTAIAATPLYGSKTAAIRNWPATIPAEGTPQESDSENISGVDNIPTEDATPNDIAPADTAPATPAEIEPTTSTEDMNYGGEETAGLEVTEKEGPQ